MAISTDDSKTMPLKRARDNRRPFHWTLNPRSLRVQMTVGSAVVALCAVLIVAAIALVAFAVTFNLYQRNQLSTEATRLATALGQAHGFPGGGVGQGPSGALDPFASGGGAPIVWVMDTSGRIYVNLPPRVLSDRTLTQDESTVGAALQRGLQGQSTDGVLPGRGFPGLTERLYAAVPIHANGDSNGKIIGAVALSTSLRTDRGAMFAAAVSRIIMLVALGVAIVAAVAAAFFSRRVTRPLANLATATAQMALGDYGARVGVEAPDELRSLATSFNEMAAALERDVGELRRQEQLRRELVANVSHELATPLTAIQGFTEALLDDVVQDPAERTETTRLIAREAARLRRLVDQLRQVALFESGTQALDRSPVQLAGLVSETLAVLAPEMERKRITMVNHMAEDLPPVFADADRLTEILLNLLDNALRHTPTGGEVSIRGVAEGQLVRVDVADSGPGIADADRGRIFDRFYRLDPSRSSATGGSGLGLAIVRALVEAHGGTIRVSERPGGGAQFSFTLPVYAPA